MTDTIKVKTIDYANWEDDPALIVTYDNGGMGCYVKRESTGWVNDDEAYRKAKLVDEAFSRRCFRTRASRRRSGSGWPRPRPPASKICPPAAVSHGGPIHCSRTPRAY